MGKIVVMLEQKWYSLIRPWIARYQRMRRRYKRLPARVWFPWIPSISFGLDGVNATIGLSSLVHWIVERRARIGCITDPITIAVDWKTGTGEIVEGNGMLTSK